MPSRLTTAIAAARAGGEVLKGLFGDRALTVEAKGRNDFVTSADKASEDAILACVQRDFPGDSILSEEAGRLVGDGPHEWIIDPLDGTTNFIQGLPCYSVSVACRKGGDIVVAAVLDPERDDLFSAERGGGAFRNGEPMRVAGHTNLEHAFIATGFPFRAKAALGDYLEVFRQVLLQAKGIRRCGSAALDLAYTASGVFDGFFEYRLSPWDVAAGCLLIEEAGGAVTDLDGGGRYLETGNIVAGNPLVQGALRALAAGVADEGRLEQLVSSTTGRDMGSC